MNFKTVNQADRPIIVGSVFKSGTWLLRKVLTEITGLEMIEPEIKPGHMDPEDPDNVFHIPGHFYSWHFTPTTKVCKKIIEMNALPIFLMRNVYDLTVSMYYHFANDIDFEIGRGANKHEYFSRISKSEGIKQIIIGNNNDEFKWKGLSTHLYQMERMLAFSGKYPCLIITYERLLENKANEIKRISRFLDIALNTTQIKKIAKMSGFPEMKAAAEKENKGSHFRNGKIRSHIKELKSSHIEMIQKVMHEHAPSLEKFVKEFSIK